MGEVKIYLFNKLKKKKESVYVKTYLQIEFFILGIESLQFEYNPL